MLPVKRLRKQWRQYMGQMSVARNATRLVYLCTRRSPWLCLISASGSLDSDSRQSFSLRVGTT